MVLIGYRKVRLRKRSHTIFLNRCSSNFLSFIDRHRKTTSLKWMLFDSNTTVFMEVNI